MKKGFIQIVIAAIIVLALGAGAIFAYQKYSQKPTVSPKQFPSSSDKTQIVNQASSSPAATDETANWKTYANTRFKFSFKYTAQFNIFETDNLNSPNNNNKYYQIRAIYCPSRNSEGCSTERNTFQITFIPNTKNDSLDNLAEPSNLCYLQDPRSKIFKTKIDGSDAISEEYIIDQTLINNGLCKNAYEITFKHSKSFLMLKDNYLVNYGIFFYPESNQKIMDQMFSTFKFASDETANWETFDYKGIFSFQYASYWKLKDCSTSTPYQDDPSVFLAPPDSPIGMCQSDGPGLIWISSYPSQTPINEPYFNDHSLSQQSVVVGNKPATKFTGTISSLPEGQSVPGSKRIIYIISSGKYIIDIIYSQAPGVKDYSKDFQSLISTIKFNQ